MPMNRRNFLPAAGLGAAAMSNAFAQSAPERKGRLKQSVCRWCYAKTPMEDLAQACVKLGIEAIDLLPKDEWPVALKHGLALTVVPGPTTIPDGLNRKENHDGIEQRSRDTSQQ